MTITKSKFGYFVQVECERHITPHDCPVCKLSFRGRDDINSFDRHGCCTDCELSLAIPNHDMWILGWRPDEDTIENHRKTLLNQPTYLYN